MASILILDDCRLWTSALERCLSEAPYFRSVSVVPSLSVAREWLQREIPQVLAIRIGIADVHVRPMARDLLRDMPDLKALAYSLNDYDPLDEAWALASGFKGYVGPYDGLHTFVSAILTIAAGGDFFVKQAGLLVADDEGYTIRASDLHHLSAREIEVFRMTGLGLCCKEIAGTIGIHIKTVDTYRKRIREKLGLRDSGELLRAAIRLSRRHATAAGKPSDS
jgi:DNA-binding NarL/FixJ family response regulator